MSVNDENHVLGLWIGGGVTPAALERLEVIIGYEVAKMKDCPLKTELSNLQNALWAQISKLPKPDPLRYL